MRVPPDVFSFYDNEFQTKSKENNPSVSASAEKCFLFTGTSGKSITVPADCPFRRHKKLKI